MCSLYHQNRIDEERCRVLASLYLLIATKVRPTGMAESTFDLISSLLFLLATRKSTPPAITSTTPAQSGTSTVCVSLTGSSNESILASRVSRV